MKILVCIKQVPDVNAPIHVKDGQLVQDADRMVLNAYDASALEGALDLTETHGGEVEVVLVGPEKAKEIIRKALAMGADRGTHILLDDSGYDPAACAALLARYLDGVEYDFIACGKQSQDTDSGLTGSMLAERLKIPYASNAIGLEHNAGRLLVRRQGDTGQEILELPAPGLVTCSNDMNEPRIPNLKGIMQSRRKPLETISPGDLGMDPGEPDIKTHVVRFEEKPVRTAGKKFEGDADRNAREVARLLGQAGLF